MKVEKLKKGMVIKNYKELCEILEIEPKKANSKVAQLKELALHVEYEKEGHKIYITNVFDRPKEKVDNRRTISAGNNKVFVDDFVSIMALRLISMKKNNSNKRTFLLSKGDVYKMAELVNDNYADARMYTTELSEHLGLSAESATEFYSNNSKKLKETTERGLRACRGMSILLHRSTIAVKVSNPIVAVNEFGVPIVKGGKVQYNVTNIIREATEEERHAILRAEREAMRELGCKNIQAVFLHNKIDKMKSIVQHKLEMSNTNILFYYEAYSIDVNEDALIEYYNDNLKHINDVEIQDRINHKMIKSIKRSTSNRHKKSTEKLISGETLSKSAKYQTQEYYKNEQDVLTDILIDRKSERINYKLERLAREKEVQLQLEEVKKLKKLNAIEEEFKTTLDWDEELLDSEVPF